MQNNPTTPEIYDERENVTNLFKSVGIETPRPIEIEQRPGETYEYEPRPQDNWLYPAFRGFQKLNSDLHGEGKPCKHFITVGTGPGIDAIGAYHIFKPQFIRVTDINERAAELALYNLNANIPAADNTIIAFDTASLLNGINLEKWGMPVQSPAPDVIYANLPNIPAKEVDEHSVAAATFVNERLLAGCPELLDRYLLALQYHFLRQAHEALPTGGSVVIALGGRSQYRIIQELFNVNKLKIEDLFSMVKIQTQPDDVLTGYANAENQKGVIFTFYDYDEVESAGILDAQMSGAELQQVLQPHAITANQSLQAHRAGKRIGHIVHILRGIKV